MISDQQLIKFQELYRKRFQREINREDAYEKASGLLRLIKIVYQPMTEAEYQKLQSLDN